MNLTWLYVAIVYAIAIWLARRAGADLPWHVAALGLIAIYWRNG